MKAPTRSPTPATDSEPGQEGHAHDLDKPTEAAGDSHARSDQGDDDHDDNSNGSSRVESVSLVISGVLVGVGLLAQWQGWWGKNGVAGLAIGGIVAGGW